MRVTMKSVFSGEISSRELDITEAQYVRWRKTGLPIQSCFPKLKSEDIEFLLSGVKVEELRHRPPLEIYNPLTRRMQDVK